MIFVDANIPMYLVGRPHPNKVLARDRVDTCIVGGERLVTDAEVFQEILHRYVALERRDMIAPAFDVLRGIVDEVFPVTLDACITARDLVLGVDRLSARDALHVAIMRSQGIKRILTFDTDYDSVHGIERVR